MTPVREQQMAGLTRDYEQSQKELRAIASRSAISREWRPIWRSNSKANSSAYSILRNLPQKPFSPNRLKLDLIGLVAGLMVGMAVLVGRRDVG